MSEPARARVGSVHTSESALRAALLVSIHDISPLTLESSRCLVERLTSAGIPATALTLLAIPCHGGHAPLDGDAPTVRWLREQVDAGVTLCMHGYTHAMVSRARSPSQWVWSQVFARGQGELFLSDEADCRQRLAAAEAVFHRAGLSAAVAGFVAPAWLMSDAARAVVRGAGFDFFEELGGIVCGGAVHARRLIGFGSLTRLEAALTGLHAHWQAGRTPADTRLALHPQDLLRPSTVAAIDSTLRSLLGRLEPQSYTWFLKRTLPSRALVGFTPAALRARR